MDFLFFSCDYYTIDWLTTPHFKMMVPLFSLAGCITTFPPTVLSATYVNRAIRNNYLPKGGLFNYVSSAHYFGETIEWIGFAILNGHGPVRCLHCGLLLIYLVHRSNAIIS